MGGEIVSQLVRALALAAVVGLLVAGAAPPAAARPVQSPTVELHTAAGLAPDGRSVTVNLLAKCPERWTVVEALVTVSQPQASGQASFPLTCNSSFQSFNVTVRSSDAPFELGEAQATASVLIERGRTAQAQDSEVVTVEPTVFVDIAEHALLQGGGEAVLIDVTTACPVGASGQQSYVNVSQGRATGNGFYTPTCDGQRHTVTVRVPASQGLFQTGSARGFTFAFIEAGGNSFSGIGERDIQIVT
jgi:hypothetical protein